MRFFSTFCLRLNYILIDQDSPKVTFNGQLNGKLCFQKVALEERIKDRGSCDAASQSNLRGLYVSICREVHFS